jgi:hypothetical protein
LATEWYAPVDAFEIIETTDYQVQSTGQTLPNDVTAEFKSVLNVGVGFRYQFTENTAGYGAFTTDFSAAVPEQTNSAIATWDLYHVTAGGEFTLRRLHFTLGLEWAFGQETLPGVDLSDIDGAGGLQDPGPSDVRYNRLTLLFGFSIGGKTG